MRQPEEEENRSTELYLQKRRIVLQKGEIFVTELFTLSDLIWISDLRTEPKNPFV
jgi:hypothetical protein